jgi:hypothetical protein
VAQRIQLDDLGVLQGDGAGRQGREETKPGTKNEQNSLIDQAVLNAYNASIDVEVQEVLSGADHLGSGTLRIEQREGKFKMDPLDLRIPGGTVHVDYSVRPAAGSDSRVYSVQVRLDNFDYGYLARRYRPDTDMSGIINLRAYLRSTSRNRQGILANGSGYLDFSVQPRQLRAGVIDLWAVNLFTYLVPLLTPKGESTINCAAGRFNLVEGILSQEELLIDTTRIRVKGKAEVDFKNNIIEARLRPIPKRPQFYSLSIPIEIKGRFSDLEAGLARGSVIGTVIRLATSYVVVPLQWIIMNRLPEDGTAACLELVAERTE